MKIVTWENFKVLKINCLNWVGRFSLEKEFSLCSESDIALFLAVVVPVPFDSTSFP